MSDEKKKEALLRKVFLDIARGFSTASYGGRLVFIKHFGIFDQEELDERYAARISKLTSQGIISEEKKLKELEEEGKWTPDHEKQLRDKGLFTKNLIKTKDALVIPSQIDQMKVKIESSKQEEIKLRGERDALLSDTAEAFASRHLNDISIYNSFYADKDLSQSFFSEEEFDELERKEIYNLIRLYNDKFEDISLENIKHLALSGLFMNYFNVKEDSPSDIFECAPLSLSFYQLNLITYAKIFKSIFKNIPDIPDEMRDDPNELLEFADSGAKSKEKVEKMRQAAAKGKQSRAQSIMGATKEDMQKMGYSEMDAMSPAEFLKKKGKTSFSLVQDGDFNV